MRLQPSPFACERTLCNRMKHTAAATCCTPLQRCAAHFLFLFLFGSVCEQPLALGHSIHSIFCSFIYLSVAIDCAKAVRRLDSESILFGAVSRRALSHSFFFSNASAFAATFFPSSFSSSAAFQCIIRPLDGGSTNIKNLFMVPLNKIIDFMRCDGSIKNSISDIQSSQSKSGKFTCVHRPHSWRTHACIHTLHTEPIIA